MHPPTLPPPSSSKPLPATPVPPFNPNHRTRPRPQPQQQPRPRPQSQSQSQSQSQPSQTPPSILLFPILVLLLLHPSLPLSVHAAPQSPPKQPEHLSLHQVVNTYLSNNDGQRKLQRAFNLPPHLYYNPLQFFTRDDATFPSSLPHAVDSNAPPRLSDLHLLRLMHMHIPGIDPLPPPSSSSSNFHSHTRRQLTTSSLPCQQDLNPITVPMVKSSFRIFFWPSDVPDPVRTVVRDTTRQWSRLFYSDVQIRICFMWQPMDKVTLGATNTPFFTKGTSFPSLRNDTLYNPALAAALHGSDVIEETDFHVHMTLNSHIHWHFEKSSLATSERFDLATIVLHELTHGLFFTGTITSTNTTAKFQQDAPARFDQFLRVERNISVAKSCLEESQLYNAIRSPNLRFLHPPAGTSIGLYAPSTFESGSSVYHFSNVTIDADCREMSIAKASCSDLMTHELRQGYTRRNVGETTLRVYEAMRGSGEGVLVGDVCNVPRYTGQNAEGPEKEIGFTLPVWGIALVAVLVGVGVLLVMGVVVSTVIARV